MEAGVALTTEELAATEAFTGVGLYPDFSHVVHIAQAFEALHLAVFGRGADRKSGGGS